MSISYLLFILEDTFKLCSYVANSIYIIVEELATLICLILDTMLGVL